MTKASNKWVLPFPPPSPPAASPRFIQVVPIYLLGAFNPKSYIRMHKDVRQQMGPARPGPFDRQGYRKLHPEVEEEGIGPFKHFKQNRRNEICVRGRVGLPDRGCVESLFC